MRNGHEMCSHNPSNRPTSPDANTADRPNSATLLDDDTHVMAPQSRLHPRATSARPSATSSRRQAGVGGQALRVAPLIDQLLAEQSVRQFGMSTCFWGNEWGQVLCQEGGCRRANFLELQGVSSEDMDLLTRLLVVISWSSSD